MKHPTSWAASTLVLLVAMGCRSAPPRSSQMTAEDYKDIAADIGPKLGEQLQQRLADRTPSSPPMVIAWEKVVNYTTDLMPSAAKCYLMVCIKDQLLAHHALLHDKNIIFVMSAEQLREARKLGTIEADTITERKPTHTLTAIFRSASRLAGKAGRTDYYTCTYEITDLATGEVVCSDSFEFTRWAKGRSFD